MLNGARTGLCCLTHQVRLAASPRGQGGSLLLTRACAAAAPFFPARHRDSAVSLRSGSPLPGIVEGSQTAGADSARGFATVSATPQSQSPKAPSTPGHSRASTPMPSAAASLASASGNSFALSVEDDEEAEGDGDGDDAEGLQVLGLKRSDMETELGHVQDQQHALPAARRLDLAQLPKGWRQSQQQQQPAVVAGGSNSSNGSKYSSTAGSNGNGKSSSNGAGNRELQQQLVGAANDIVPLNGMVASDRVTAGGSGKGQQAAQHQ